MLDFSYKLWTKDFPVQSASIRCEVKQICLTSGRQVVLVQKFAIPQL